MNKIYQNYRMFKIYVTQLYSLYLWKNRSPPLCVIHIQNVWISSFTLSSLNLYYVVKITQKLRFKKKYRFLQISTILGMIPIVNVVISRFCALWFNFLYDFIYNVPNMHEFIVKMPFSDLKYHF